MAKSKDRTAPPAGQAAAKNYVLRLYVSGMTSRSMAAIENIQAVCEAHLQGSYKLQVIDIYQQPELASSAQIIAAPTLIKQLPLPLRKLVGDFSEKEQVLVGLGLAPRPPAD